MSYIVTHPSDAHLDDFLSCCLILAKEDNIIKIERREPTERELKDPSIWKVDIGKDYNTDLKIFDHHQRDWEECSFSLLLKFWNIWTDAINFYRWIETAVIFDSKGPTEARKRLRVDKFTAGRLESFIDRSTLELFSDQKTIENVNWLFSFMKIIGTKFFNNIEDYKTAMEIVKENSKITEISGVGIITCMYKKNGDISNKIFYKAMEDYKKEKIGLGGIAIYPNERPKGSVAIERFDDDNRIDFKDIPIGDGIVFVHANGFFMVLNNVGDYELEEIIRLGIKKSPKKNIKRIKR